LEMRGGSKGPPLFLFLEHQHPGTLKVNDLRQADTVEERSARGLQPRARMP
jgi:hypothetical protein